MKAKKSSPVKLKQSKITAFCSPREKGPGNASPQVNRKRKNAEEVSEVHSNAAKRPAKSPDLFQVTTENGFNENVCRGIGLEVKTHFEDFAFDDFENDPFLSPKKKESPKKGVLREISPGNETWESQPDTNSELNLEKSTKCRVMKTTFVTGRHFEKVLLVSEVATHQQGFCRLRDVWTSLELSAGDVLCIQAISLEGQWVVDNKNGHVILHPDVTISSTTLMKSMFCLRQGVLTKYFKEMDAEGSGRMLIGRLVHELFQESLRTNARSEEDLRKIIGNFMESRENLECFYFSDVKVADILKEMKDSIPHVRKFLEVYINEEAPPTGRNFQGTIDDVIDIEELIKSPKLGFQGRVDVTVRLRSKTGEKIAPLELKTGRASFSKEHRTQLVTYVLLMKELGRNVDSGLLFYLREDILEEVFPERDEMRNLFLLRNHFVDMDKRFRGCALPEPIRNAKACGRCPQLRICTAYLKSEEFEKLSETHPLRSLEVPDVKPRHVEYFIKWIKMLCLEYEDVFLEAGDEYEVSELRLEPNVECLKEEFRCRFRKGKESGGGRTLRPGTFVHVLNEKSSRICSGRVLEVTDSVISVATDKQLDDFSAFYKVIVFKSNFFSTYLSNLGWFLNEEFENLRELIIEKRPPVFEKNLSKTDFKEKCLKLLLRLNREQQKAVLKSLLCRDYVLIKGPPGTGKTQTILTLVKVLLALNKTILIASHTHSSVDNILLRLDGVEYLRLGSLKSIRKEIRENSYSFLMEKCESVEDVKKLFERKVIASTCLGIDVDFVRKIKVEYCIVDESSQVLQPEVLRPLFSCKKFILVGDEDQLPPIVRNPQAKELGMDKSMFEWLSSEESVVRLSLQYRMNSVINSLANAITYGGLIECGNEEVARATMKVPNRDGHPEEDGWVVDVLSNRLEDSVVFVDTSEYFRSSGKKSSEPRSSVLEANIIVKLIICLIKFGLKEESVGVIAPFWDQISLLKKKLADNNLPEIELNTVDQYQGRDKDVILFSCTKENQAEKEAAESELLNDERRLTVAVTRAKHKLIITGDRETVARYKPFKKLIDSMSDSQFFYLSNGERNFFWENFVN